MKVFYIEQYGETAEFSCADVEIPVAKDDEVLIKVCATNINPIDAKIRAGLIPHMEPALPAVLHGDLSGVITACGSSVTEFAVGDEVYGCVGGVGPRAGSLSEYVTVPIDFIAKKPDSLSLTEAAAMPLVGITACIALFEKLQLKSGEPIFIHAGVGGVGNIACQLAKSVGAEIYTTVGDQKAVELLQDMGFEYIINYKNETPKQYKERYMHQGFSKIFDTVGMNNLQYSFEAAAFHGHIACTQTLVPSIDLSLMHKKGLTLSSILMLDRLMYSSDITPYSYYLSQLTELIDRSHIKPLLDQQMFSVDDVSKAYQYFSIRDAIGKVILTF